MCVIHRDRFNIIGVYESHSEVTGYFDLGDLILGS